MSKDTLTDEMTVVSDIAGASDHVVEYGTMIIRVVA